MNYEIWKVFVSLGVPGLALGIFYMLFKTFKWDFPKVPSIWVGPIILIFMILTFAITFYALFLYGKPSDNGGGTGGGDVLIEDIIKTVDCEKTGTVDKIDAELTKMINELWPKLCRDVPRCCSQLGLTDKYTPDFDYATIYNLKKCEKLNSLKPDMPVEHIKKAYLYLKDLAAKMECVQHQEGDQAKSDYTSDWSEFGEQYDFWNARARNSH